MKPFDRRLVPARPELAAAHLEGVVDAARFVRGRPARITAPVADVRAEPRPDCPLDTQAIFGETVTVYDETEGYAWVQLDRDGYVGWLPEVALGPEGPAPTHRVTVPRTLRFPGPDFKAPNLGTLTQGALVTVAGLVERRGVSYAILPDGSAMVARHLASLDEPPPGDFVSVAEAYVGTPYLWGGRTSLGLDCSGLVQTALAMAGVDAPRDSDMQEAVLGEPVPANYPDGWARGDLVFWKGHVGIVSAPGRLLHANAYHMAVVEEQLVPALERIAAAGSAVTSARRPARSGR
jgi:cell wall-associated NlpC family hydrolase